MKEHIVRNGGPIGKPEERLFELISRVSTGSRVLWCDETRRLLDEIKTGTRNRIAADLNRAEKPKFANGEDPVIVVKTTRAIDIRLVEMGSDAPYYVAPDKQS